MHSARLFRVQVLGFLILVIAAACGGGRMEVPPEPTDFDLAEWLRGVEDLYKHLHRISASIGQSSVQEGETEEGSSRGSDAQLEAVPKWIARIRQSGDSLVVTSRLRDWLADFLMTGVDELQSRAARAGKDVDTDELNRLRVRAVQLLYEISEHMDYELAVLDEEHGRSNFDTQAILYYARTRAKTRETK